MSDIAIIGAGRLGTLLGHALSLKGHRIKAISDRDLSQARESHQLIGQGVYVDDNGYAARLGQWIILTVPDDAIGTVAKEIGSLDISWEDKFVFHCSGLQSTESLNPLEKKGALVASIHPIQSFPKKKPNPAAFQNIFFGLEGKGEALEWAKKISLQLGGKFFIIEAQNKPLYHTACSMASNFLVTLLDAAIEMLEQAGLTRSEASKILLPLVQGTLQNVKKFDAGAALTGPVARGDSETIARHLDALQRTPELRDLYTTLAIRSLQLARKEKKMPEKFFRALKILLEGK